MFDTTYNRFGIMSVMNDNFSDWLNLEIERREMSQAKLAKSAGISRTSISDILSGKQRAGFDVCVAISRALHIAPENVLRAAGLLPPVAGNVAEKEDLLHLFDQMSKEKKKDLLNYAQFLLAKKD